ncbi:MAG: GTP-binding protein [Alphaproteobacteria bacterium]
MTEITSKAIKFLTCGHVDDGKSTLIGRLIYDLGVVPEDQIEASKDADGKIDYALFTDGLEDERRQGITIDVAYRYFKHEDCRYRIADTPGHLEYMRNMAVAAVESDVAMILIDAVHGIRLQSIEYSKIAKFFGVKRFLVTINKMDAIDYDEEKFNAIRQDYLDAFLEEGDGCEVTFVPVSALEGDNVVHASDKTDWYKGTTVFDYLRNVKEAAHTNISLRLPIQQVIKDDAGQRWYLGTLHGEVLSVGEQLMVAEGECLVTVEEIYHSGRSVKKGERRQAIAVRIVENVDISRGAILTRPDSSASVGEAFDADVLWTDKSHNAYADGEKTTLQGIIKLHHKEEQVQVDVDNTNGGVLKSARVFLARSTAMDPYVDNPHTGLFIIIDPYTERVIMVGTVKNVIPPHYMGSNVI